MKEFTTVINNSKLYIPAAIRKQSGITKPGKVKITAIKNTIIIDKIK